MTRTILALLAAAVVATGVVPSQAAATATRNRSFQMGYGSSSGSVFMNVSVVTDLTGAQPETVSGCVDVSVSSGYDFGCGPMIATFDPVAATGTIAAALQGYNGPITLSVSFRVSRVGTNSPYADVEVIPAPATLTANGYHSINGRSNGTISTAYGSLTVTNASSNVFDSYSVVVQP